MPLTRCAVAANSFVKGKRYTYVRVRNLFSAILYSCLTPTQIHAEACGDSRIFRVSYYRYILTGKKKLWQKLQYYHISARIPSAASPSRCVIRARPECLKCHVRTVYPRLQSKWAKYMLHPKKKQRNSRVIIIRNRRLIIPITLKELLIYR